MPAVADFPRWLWIGDAEESPEPCAVCGGTNIHECRKLVGWRLGVGWGDSEPAGWFISDQSTVTCSFCVAWAHMIYAREMWGRVWGAVEEFEKSSPCPLESPANETWREKVLRDFPDREPIWKSYIRKELKMKRQITILAGPERPATLQATLPLLTYLFERLLGHQEHDQAITLRQVETLAHSIAVEYAAPSLEEPLVAAANAALNVLMGGAVEASAEPNELYDGRDICEFRDARGTLWCFKVSTSHENAHSLHVSLPEHGRGTTFVFPYRQG